MDAILSDYFANILTPDALIAREIALLLVRKPRLIAAKALPVGITAISCLLPYDCCCR